MDSSNRPSADFLHCRPEPAGEKRTARQEAPGRDAARWQESVESLLTDLQRYRELYENAPDSYLLTVQRYESLGSDRLCRTLPSARMRRFP
jgi:hypothetical protein